MPHRSVAEITEVSELRGRVLPFGPSVSFASSPEWDETEVDYSDPEQITITQTDEHGVTHLVILPLAMMTKLRNHTLRWLTANTLD